MGSGIQYMLFAGMFVALSNLFLRRSIDAGGTSRAFLMIQLLFTFIVAVIMHPISHGNYMWDTSIALLGCVGGVILAAFMSSMGKAIEYGPSGLTFAILNSSSVFPIFLMVLLFGVSFGYVYTFWNGIGSILVIAGLFWAGWETMRSEERKKWMILTGAAFVLHIFFIVFMQYRALLVNFPGHKDLFLSLNEKTVTTHWFMPMIFLTAAFIQTIVFFKQEKRIPKKQEGLYGILGGAANGIGTFLMIRSTEVASSLENAMIFPLYSVTIILGCNLWGQWLYREKVNWKANTLCIMGVLVGTLDWKVFM